MREASNEIPKPEQVQAKSVSVMKLDEMYG